MDVTATMQRVTLALALCWLPGVALADYVAMQEYAGMDCISGQEGCLWTSVDGDYSTCSSECGVAAATFDSDFSGVWAQHCDDCSGSGSTCDEFDCATCNSCVNYDWDESVYYECVSSGDQSSPAPTISPAPMPTVDCNLSDDYTGHAWFWALFGFSWFGCCIASWTFGIIGLCNAPKLGTGQPLCCGCSPSNTYNANVCLSGGNFFMFLMYLIVVLIGGMLTGGMLAYVVDIGGMLTYVVLGGVTAAAAVQLKQKKEHWNAPIGVQPYGQPAHGQPHSQPVMGQPVMGHAVMGAPVQGMPVQGMPVQPAMGGPVMVNGQPMKTY